MYHCLVHDLKMPDFLLPVAYLFRYGYEVNKDIIKVYSHQVAKMIGYVESNFANDEIVNIDRVPHLVEYLEVESQVF